ncbi:molybdopterin-dependent oxidoreductase [Phaeacidiphilus oryzae]|jgi:DMSO/TMAO reductase YedYZ molybdopterin-dependent catalytic subunit|uniref:molybdopterin-dependent oxidoreductase n=1 Tax=Phaeacidiphilus oryzae TaxID=348818 RepID=UPI0009FCC031|nr:molybdopterin-dependent oxidoreductase [Phaeacidiphilus oryzae]
MARDREPGASAGSDDPGDERADGTAGRGSDRAEAPGRPAGAPVGRRVVLGLLGLGAVGVATGSALQNGLDNALAGVESHDPTGVTGLIPGGGFEFYSVADSIPHRSPAAYTLTVSGLVDRPLTLSLDQLKALPPTRLVRDVQCVTGWRVPRTAFTGVRLSDLLDRAGVRPGARALRFICYDGVYTESLTLDQARRPDMMVAYAMNDRPVSDAHGGPVRLYAAPMYFYKSAKWLAGITVTDHVQPGYWEHYGYDVDAWVGRSNGRDDEPTS